MNFRRYLIGVCRLISLGQVSAITSSEPVVAADAASADASCEGGFVSIVSAATASTTVAAGTVTPITASTVSAAIAAAVVIAALVVSAINIGVVLFGFVPLPESSV